MNVLLLCEGNAETPNSWSGTSKSLIEALRAAGNDVRAGDADLYGVARLLAAARTFSPNRRRWWVKFHLGALPFRLRTEAASRAIDRHADWTDLVFQIGATFDSAASDRSPYVVYCDSNILLAERARTSGYSDAVSLTSTEIEAIRHREASVYDGAAAILTMSHMLRQSFIDDFGVHPDRVHTVHAGPNFDVGAIPYPRSPRLAGPPTVLFVGRQFERKGGDILLMAFREVRRRLTDARLVIVGPAKLNLDEPGVEVLGFLPKANPDAARKLHDAYARADVFCMPTRFEPFGIAFLEAMYFGLPCVGPNAWAVPEIIVDGETGFAVEPGNPAAFASRLFELLRDPATARRMGDAGRARATEYFTWDATARRILAAIEPPTRVRR